MRFETPVIDGLVEHISRPNKNRAIFPLLEPLEKYFERELRAPGGLDYINFYGTSGALTSISLAELFRDSAGGSAIDPQLFRDRAVFIGAKMDAQLGITGLKDIFTIPVERSSMWGVEIQASIAANLLDQSWIRRLKPTQEISLLTVAVFGLTFFVSTVGLVRSLVGVPLLAGPWLGSSYYAFTAHYLWLPGATLCFVIAPLLLLLHPIGLGLQKWREARRV